MKKDDPDGDDRTYFTLEIDGRLYCAWYRRLPGHRVEVCTQTKLRVALVGRLSIEEQARRILNDLVRDEGR